MRKAYQLGGDVQNDEDLLAGEVGTDFGGVGPLSTLDPNQAMLLGLSQMFNRTTTPEAQAFSRRFLTQMMDDQQNRAPSAALEKMRGQADQVRQALKTARDRLNAQKSFSRGEILLAIGQGLGAPTRTGAFGETAGNVAGLVREPLAAKRQFEQQRDNALSELDLAEAGVDSGVINAEFELEKLREQLQNRMGVEALDNLGRATTSTAGLARGLQGIIPDSAKALDSEYVKEYLPFVTGGNAKAAQGLAALEFAADIMERGNDALTGPYAGAVANLPYVGRWLQAYTSPEGADVRDLVETTIQESLRPVLGSQFTEREGERLIARAFNPNLEEWRNARRLRALLQQLNRAYESKVEMAEYYTNNGTLFRYPNLKIGYSPEDFTFDEQGAEEAPREQTQFRDLPARERETQLAVWMEQNPGKQPPDWMLEGMAKGGRVKKKRFQQGGAVAFDPPPDRTLSQDIEDIWAEYGDPVGMGLGASGALIADSALDTLLQRAVGGRERRVADAISSGGLDPVAVAEDIKRNRRAGVPDTLMDTDTAGIHALTEEAMRYGDAGAEQAIRNLRTRLEGSRERVNDRVNAGLKPDEFFDQENRLVNRLANERVAEMKQVFDAHPAISIDPVISKILDTPEGKRAMDWAFKFYSNVPGRKIGPADLQGMVEKPSLEFYDYIRKGFNQTIAREEAKGATEFGDVLRDLRQMYLDRLDQIAPEYKTARQAAGDDLDVRDALHAGRSFMKLQPEQLEEVANNLSFHERNAFRTGMAQNIYEVLDKSHSQNFNAAQRLVGSPALVERLRPFFDTPSQFKVFQMALEREAEMFRTGQETLATAEKARTNREKTRQSPWEYVAQRGPGFRFSISPMGWALRIFRDMPKMTPKEANAVLGILQSGKPEEMNAFANKVRNLKMLRRTRNPRRVAAAGLGAAAGMLLGGDEEE